MKEVVWAPTARKSLRSTVDLLSERWNDRIKAEFFNQLNFRIKQIQRNPELAPAFEDSPVRKPVIHKNVSLFYLNQPDTIRLLLIWENRQNPAGLYQSLTGSQGDK